MRSLKVGPDPVSRTESSRFEDLDGATERLATRLANVPLIPLVVKLLVSVYRSTGRIPDDTATLFSDYVDHVLRPEATGIEEPLGLHIAIQHLVRETFLRSGGDRGCSVETAVALLAAIKERLAHFEITNSPVGVIRILTRAGLYKRTGNALRFFHDTFESYFAARAMESDIRDGKATELRKYLDDQRLKEAWTFLGDILGADDRAGVLETLGVSSLQSGPLRSVKDAAGGTGIDPEGTVPGTLLQTG